MTEEAFKSLVRMCGMSNGQLEKINSAPGEKTGAKLLDMMKVAMPAHWHSRISTTWGVRLSRYSNRSHPVLVLVN